MSGLLFLSLCSLMMMSTMMVFGDVINFRLGVQLCDGSAGSNKGDKRYTPYLFDLDYDSDDIEDGFSVWAGDSNYYDPDGMRIGIFAGDEEEKKAVDFRFCIQLTDHASDKTGNSAKEGDIECTPWASEGGGWSDFAGDSNFYDFDAVRVGIDARSVDEADANPEIIDVKVGVQLTDDGTNTDYKGDKEKSPWVFTEGGGWSDWASDSNWYDPDSIRVWMKVEVVDDEAASQADNVLAVNMNEADDAALFGAMTMKSGLFFYAFWLLAAVFAVHCAWSYYCRRAEQGYKQLEDMDDDSI